MTDFLISKSFKKIGFSIGVLLATCGFVGQSTPVHAQKGQVLRVEPPHWYLGINSGNLEILIHGRDMGLNTFELNKNANGIRLDSVGRLPNPNYALLYVTSSPEAPVQEVLFRSEGKAGKFNLPYAFKERSNHKRGLDQSDVIYLITPDRFANGDPDNDVVAGMNQTNLDRTEPYERHGGDIQGMIDHLDYIQSLGMTAIWPNPLLENDQPHESYHGYAFTDYYNIDSRFGTNELYKAFCDSVHARGMKMIMDVVYNHIGNAHFLYTDMPDPDWFHQYDTFTQTNYRDPALYDPYASSYDKNRMTDGWFDKHMPDLNQRNPRLATYLIQQSIWWVEAFDIEALRIDTYAYPDADFMRDWGKALKEAYPDLFLFAETWVHGTPSQAWFMGDALGPEPNHLDGLTDFQIYYAINDALTKDQGWTDGIARLYYTLAADYVYQNPEHMVTFLDNHDLARFYGYVNKDYQKFKIGMTMLFTMRGIPSIYYGTELLMAETDGHGKIREDVMGGWPGDSLNKFTPEGRSIDENNAFNLIKSLAELRRTEPALRSGRTTQFVPEKGAYVYFRHDEKDTWLIAINVSDKEQRIPFGKLEEKVPSGAKLEGFWGPSQTAKGHLYLPEKSVEIYRVVK